jgi:hypothetical protein
MTLYFVIYYDFLTSNIILSDGLYDNRLLWRFIKKTIVVQKRK